MVQVKRIRNGVGLLLTAVFMTVMMLSVAPAAHAQQTYKVYCNNGVGPVADLIQAIEDSNASPGLDTIVFMTYGQSCYFDIHNIYDHTSLGAPVGLPIITDDLIISANGGFIQRHIPQNDDVHPVFRLLHVDGDHYVKLANMRFVRGHSVSGAAVHIAEGELELFNVAFTDNTAQSTGGAVVAKDLTIQNARFTNNNAGTWGGAVYMTGKGIINEGHFIDNNAQSFGGGLANHGGSLTVTNSEFLGNVGKGGGGLAVYLGTNVELSHSVFKDNYGGTGFGGGADIFVNNAFFTAKVVNNLWLRNDAKFGAALAVHGVISSEEAATTVDILHNTIDGQMDGEGFYRAAIELGIAQNHRDHAVNVANNIIVNSTTAVHGVASNPNITTDSNIYFGNGANEIDIANSINHIVGDPQFVYPGHDDYQLLGSSPAIDNGQFVPVYDDLLGVARPQGGAPDMGAYEFVQ